MKQLILALCLSLLAFPALAKTYTHVATLADTNADIIRVENYLNGLKSISADFTQMDDSGGTLTGKIQIQRPGKMRVTYAPPSKDFIVADGNTVHIWNSDLQSQTNIDEGSSLAEFILRDPIHLSGEVQVTNVQHLPAKLEVTLVQKNDPAQGQLTLIFEDNPLRLRQWRVVDAQGVTTGVNLQNVEEDVSFPSTTFDFVPPNFGVHGKAMQEN